MTGLYNRNFFLILFIFGCAGSPVLLWLFSSCGERGYFLVAVLGLPTAAASPATAEHRLSDAPVPGLQKTGSVVVAAYA